MNWMPKILPADVVVSPYESIVDGVSDGNIETIIALLVFLIPIAAIITIIIVATKKSKKKKKAKTEEIMNRITDTFPQDK